jgi:hypothetical protein
MSLALIPKGEEARRTAIAFVAVVWWLMSGWGYGGTVLSGPFPRLRVLQPRRFPVTVAGGTERMALCAGIVSMLRLLVADMLRDCQKRT